MVATLPASRLADLRSLETHRPAAWVWLVSSRLHGIPSLPQNLYFLYHNFHMTRAGHVLTTMKTGGCGRTAVSRPQSGVSWGINCGVSRQYQQKSSTRSQGQSRSFLLLGIVQGFKMPQAWPCQGAHSCLHPPLGQIPPACLSEQASYAIIVAGRPVL